MCMISTKRFSSGVRSRSDRNEDGIGDAAIGAIVVVSLALPIICCSSLAGRMDKINERRDAEYMRAFGGGYNSMNGSYSSHSITNRFVGP